MTDPSTSYAWNWFSLHSTQRMQMFNYWLIAIAFLSTAFVEASKSHLKAVSLGVALTGCIASLSFMRLDARTRQLIIVAETALRIHESHGLAAAQKELALITEAHRNRGRLQSYRVLIQGLEAVVAVLFAFGAVWTATQ